MALQFNTGNLEEAQATLDRLNKMELAASTTLPRGKTFGGKIVSGVSVSVGPMAESIALEYFTGGTADKVYWAAMGQGEVLRAYTQESGKKLTEMTPEEVERAGHISRVVGGVYAGIEYTGRLFGLQKAAKEPTKVFFGKFVRKALKDDALYQKVLRGGTAFAWEWFKENSEEAAQQFVVAMAKQGIDKDVDIIRALSEGVQAFMEAALATIGLVGLGGGVSMAVNRRIEQKFAETKEGFTPTIDPAAPIATADVSDQGEMDEKLTAKALGLAQWKEDNSKLFELYAPIATADVSEQGSMDVELTEKVLDLAQWKEDNSQLFELQLPSLSEIYEKESGESEDFETKADALRAIYKNEKTRRAEGTFSRAEERETLYEGLQAAIRELARQGVPESEAVAMMQPELNYAEIAPLESAKQDPWFKLYVQDAGGNLRLALRRYQADQAALEIELSQEQENEEQGANTEGVIQKRIDMADSVGEISPTTEEQVKPLAEQDQSIDLSDPKTAKSESQRDLSGIDESQRDQKTAESIQAEPDVYNKAEEKVLDNVIRDPAETPETGSEKASAITSYSSESELRAEAERLGLTFDGVQETEDAVTGEILRVAQFHGDINGAVQNIHPYGEETVEEAQERTKESFSTTAKPGRPPATVFEPSGLLFDRGLGFYSPAAIAIEEMRQETFTPRQLLGQLRKMPGIKQEELDDLGLEEFLTTKGAKITKAEVLEFIRSGGVQLEEAVNSAEADGVGQGRDEVSDQMREAYVREIGTLTEDIEESFSEWVAGRMDDETLSNLTGIEVSDYWHGGATKFGAYTLPGGENYRELLLTLPEREFSALDVRTWYETSDYKTQYAKEDIEWTRLDPEAQAEVTRAYKRAHSIQEFKSSHWDEPNVLAHIRLNDRTGPNGEKILFIEEIQSDWHQAGKKGGYTSDSAKVVEDLKNKYANLPGNTDEWSLNVLDNAGVNTAEAQRWWNAIMKGSTPNAPHKKSWPMLAFKRVLKMAVDRGYDSVAWTPGEVQNDRYDLSKRVRGIEWKQNGPKKQVIIDTYEGGDIEIGVNENGIVGGIGTERSGIQFDGNHIADVVGKEIGEKILKEKYGDLTGEGLRVGGEGMRGFYDKILPKEVQKYVKKMGGKVGTIKVPASEALEIRDQTPEDEGSIADLASMETKLVEAWSLPITDTMRQDILNLGQPVYEPSGLLFDKEKPVNGGRTVSSQELSAPEDGRPVGTKAGIQDIQYMDAVNSGNMKAARKMVWEAAKDAGFLTEQFTGRIVPNNILPRFIESMPQRFIDEISSWKTVSKSPYSDSFYSEEGISWDYKPEGVLRVGDHWNFWSHGERHILTDVPVENQSHWTLARHENGTWKVMESIPKPKGTWGVDYQGHSQNYRDWGDQFTQFDKINDARNKQIDKAMRAITRATNKANIGRRAQITKREWSKSRGSFRLVGEETFEGTVEKTTPTMITIITDLGKTVRGKDYKYLDDAPEMAGLKGVPPAASYFINNDGVIKLADPVTYDEKGNVIPLSQRFDLKNPNILYEPSGVVDKSTGGSIPFEYETRTEDYTTNRQLASEALKSLPQEGRAADIRRRGTPVKIIASSIPKEFARKGHVSLSGLPLSNDIEIMQAARMVRSGFETSRFLFLNNNDVVVNELASSARLPGAATFPSVTGVQFQQINAMAKNSGATKIALYHNHPSGSTIPSEMDFLSTRIIAEEIQKFSGLKFDGHIIGNHDEFSVIDEFGKLSVNQQQVNVIDEKDAGAIKYDTKQPFLGHTANSITDLYQIGKWFSDESENNIVLLGMLDAKLVAVGELPLAFVNQPLNKTRAIAATRKFARDTASQHVVMANVPTDADAVDAFVRAAYKIRIAEAILFKNEDYIYGLSRKKHVVMGHELGTEGVMVSERDQDLWDSFSETEAEKAVNEIGETEAEKAVNEIGETEAEKAVNEIAKSASGKSRIVVAENDGGKKTPEEITEDLMKQPIDLPVEKISQKIRRKIQDSLSRSEQVVNLADTVKSVDDAENFRLKAELFIGRASAQIEDKLNEFDLNRKGSFMQRMVAAGYDIPQISEYLYAQFAPTVNAQVLERSEGKKENGSGMTDAEAREILSKYEGTNIEQYAQEFRDLTTKQTLDTLVSGGFIKPELYATLKQQSDLYVPFKKDPTNKSYRTGRGQGYSVTTKGIYRRKGRTSLADSPFVQGLLDYEDTVVRAEKNKVGQSLLKFIEKHPDIKTDTGEQLFGVKTQQYIPSYNENGDVVLYNKRYQVEDNEISVWVDGQQKIITINDEALARGLKNLGVERGVKFLNSINSWLRAVITMTNPEFMIRNFQRDLQTALINISKEDAKGVRREMVRNVFPAIQGGFEAIRGKTEGEWVKAFNDYRAQGGKTGWFENKNLDERFAQFEKKIKNHKKTGNLAAATRATIDFVESMNEAVENGVRLTAYKALVDRGTSKEQAASVAKNLTVNFNKKGEWGALINSIYLFSNASIQGTAIIAEGLIKSAKVRQFAAGLVLAGVIQTLINKSLQDEDEYDRLEEYVKDSNWLLMLPNGNHLKFKLPFGFSFFVAVGNVIAESALGDISTGQATKRVFDAAIDAFSPLGSSPSLSQLVAPTVVDPFVQIEQNENFFGGPVRPEQPPYQPRIPEHQLYFESVRKPTKALTDWLFKATGGEGPLREDFTIDISPENIDHFIDFMAGGTGKFIANAIETGTSLAKSEVPKLNNIPISRVFYGETSEYADTRIVYDALKEAGRTRLSEKDKERFYKSLDRAVGSGKIKAKNKKNIINTFEDAQSGRKYKRESFLEEKTSDLPENPSPRWMKTQIRRNFNEALNADVVRSTHKGSFNKQYYDILEEKYGEEFVERVKSVR